MNKKQELGKNTLILMVGKFCTQFASFFLLPLYTKILSTSEYGIVDLFNTIVSLLLPIVTLQIENGIFRFLIPVRNDNDGKVRTISSGLLAVGIQIICYLIIFCIIAPYINNDYKWFLASNVIVNIILSIFLQISRGLGKNALYAIGSFVSITTTLVLNVVFLVIFHMGVTGMLLGTFMGAFVSIIYLFITNRLYKYISLKRISKDEIKKLLRYSIPLVPNATSWWIFDSSDRIIVSAFLGVAANGVLSMAYKFPMAFQHVYSIFNMSWTESAALYIDHEDSNSFFTETINTTFQLFSSVGLLITAAMPIVFPILINRKFDFAYYLIPIMMIATIFNVIQGQYSVFYIAKKKTAAIAKSAFASAIMNMVINLLLIHFIGLFAAALSTALSYGCLMIYRYIDVKKYVHAPLSKKLIIQTIIGFCIVLPFYYIRNLILCIVLFCICMLIVFFQNKHFITSIVRKVMKKTV